MSMIQVCIENLNAKTAALKTSGEAFTSQQLNSIDTRSTISAVKSSIDSINKANTIHMTVGEYLVQSATAINGIGERFFEMDESAAAAMGIEAR